MTLYETGAAIQRTVDAKFTDFSDAMAEAIRVYGIGGDNGQRQAAFSKIAVVANNLYDILASQDRPDWLKQIRAAATKFINEKNNDSAKQLLDKIILFKHDINRIVLADESHEEYDFDKIFDRLREKHGLTELFDRLAVHITAILESGEIDGSTALSALKKMIAALKANREGSFASMQGSFDYYRLAWNYVRELLKLIPGVAQYAAAVEKTIEEGKAKLKTVNEELNNEALALLVESVPNIKKLAQYAEQVQPLRLESAKGSTQFEEANFEFKKDERNNNPTAS